MRVPINNHEQLFYFDLRVINLSRKVARILSLYLRLDCLLNGDDNGMVVEKASE